MSELSEYVLDEQGLDKLVEDMPAQKSRNPGKADGGRSNQAGRTMHSVHSASVPALAAKLSRPGGKKKKTRRRTNGLSYDMEDLELINLQVKKRCAELEKENMHLRSVKQRHENKIAHRDKEIELILKKSISEGDPSGSMTALMHEKTMVVSLRRKIREINQNLDNKDEELKHIKGQLKFSQLNELQILVQEYYNEILRLRKFNELGREPDSHTKLSVLTELKRLRVESNDLHAENAELNHRLTDMELQTEHKVKQMQRKYMDQIRVLETQIDHERSKASELEQLGDISRQQLDQVINNTEGTRKAMDEYIGQISMLKAKIRSRELELDQVKCTLKNLESVQKSELESIIQGNQTIMNKSSREIATLKVEVDRLQSLVKSSEQGVNVEKEQLQAELGVAQASRERAEQAVASLKESREKLQLEFAESTRLLNQESSAQKACISRLEEQVGELNRSLNSRKQVEDDVEATRDSRLSDAQAELRRLKGQYEMVCKELRSSGTEYEEVKGKLLRAERELDVIKSHIIKHREARKAGDQARAEAEVTQKEIEKIKNKRGTTTEEPKVEAGELDESGSKKKKSKKKKSKKTPA